MAALSAHDANAALARAKNRDHKHALAMRAVEGAFVRKSVGVLAAGTMGAMKRAAVPEDVKGFPWKLGLWTVAQLAQVLLDGMPQQVAGGIADSTISIYTYNAVVKGTLIAGEGGEF
jgi:hypothetical protein